MRFKHQKMFLIFSVTLIFVFSGELAAQTADNLYLNPSSATLEINEEENFIARLTSSDVGIEGELIYFSLTPGQGSVDPTSEVTGPTGYVQTTYTAGTTAGTDTLVAYWYEPTSRQDLADTSIITIVPDPATSLIVTPEDTVVVVTEDVIVVAELFDDYFNHVDAANPAQVSFTTDGLGNFGTASVNGDNGCIEVTYTTDDSMATDIITTELLSNSTRDYNTVYTIGAAPVSMNIHAEDSVVFVEGYAEELICSLFDAYDNPSGISDYYRSETYKVFFTVSEGGGTFDGDSIWVNTDGVGYNEYYSSNVAGVYTVTATSGAAVGGVDITQILGYPDSLYLTSDSIGIPVGSDTVLTARLTSSGVGVEVERVYFYVLDPPALGSINPEDSLTNDGGYAYTTYTASTACGVDTLVVTWYEETTRQDLVDTVIITINPGLIAGFNVQLEGGETEIWIYEDTVNIEVTAIDIFGNTTDVGLPLNAHLSANRIGVVFTGGEIRLMDNSIELYPMVATAGGEGLIIRVEDLSNPSVNGESYPITVYPIDFIEESPVVSGISASFGTGAISYAIAGEGEVTIKVYNKVGMEVGSLVDGTVKRGYYQTSLKELNLPSDTYFVVMVTPDNGIKKVKTTLIK